MTKSLIGSKNLKKFFAQYPEAFFPSHQGNEEILDYRSELIKAAQDIYKKTKRPIWLSLSGGLDSLVMAESFFFARVPFKCLILRFKDDANISDVSSAVAMCEKLRVAYEIVEVDFLKFLSEEAPQYMEQSKCVTPLLTLHMKSMEMIHKSGGFLVLGCGDPAFHVRGKKFFYADSANIWCLKSYADKKKLACEPYFFLRRPQALISLMRSQLIVDCAIFKKLPVRDYQTFKFLIYRQYFPVPNLPKRTGAEIYESALMNLGKRMIKRFGPPKSEKFYL